MLPRVSRTFAINIALLSGSFGESVRVAYLLCRTADALEDSWPGPPDEVARRFDLFSAAIDGHEDAAHELARGLDAQASSGPDLELLVGLPRVLRVRDTLAARDRESITEAVHIMAAGMRRFAVRAAHRARETGASAPYIDTDEELHDYCWVVAGCVGVMLTRLFNRLAPAGEAREAERLALAPVVGEALQLTNIVLDWTTDLERGRCHVPAAWLAETGVSPAELTDLTRPGVRDLSSRMERLARAALSRVPEYLDTIPIRHVRYRLFCLWPALWALASLRHARRHAASPPAARRPRLPRAALWWIAARSALVAHHRDAVRRLVSRTG
jgi:farnesyl-diphosphate farnesyltransferase